MLDWPVPATEGEAGAEGPPGSGVERSASLSVDAL